MIPYIKSYDQRNYLQFLLCKRYWIIVWNRMELHDTLDSGTDCFRNVCPLLCIQRGYNQRVFGSCGMRI